MSAEQQTQPPALELRAWIAEADRRGLIATIDEIAALPLDAEARLISLEYSKFRLHEYGSRYPQIQTGVDYPPTVFFAPLGETFTPTGPVRDVMLCYHAEEGGIHQSMKPMVPGKLVLDDGTIVPKAGIHSVRADRQAHAGSGDGFGRYILWSALAASAMPRVFNGPDYC